MENMDVVQGVKDATEDAVMPSDEPSNDENVEPSETDILRKQLQSEMSNHGRTRKSEEAKDKRIADLEARIAKVDREADEALLEGLEGRDKTDAQRLIDMKKALTDKKRLQDERERAISTREKAQAEEEAKLAPQRLSSLIAEVAGSARVTPESLKTVIDTVGLENPTKTELEGLTVLATKVKSPQQSLSVPAGVAVSGDTITGAEYKKICDNAKSPLEISAAIKGKKIIW